MDHPDISEAWRCNIVLSLENGEVSPRREAVVGEDAAAAEPDEPPTTAALVEQAGVG